MSVRLLAEHHFGARSLQGGCTGSSESTLVKIPHCWKSHVAAQMGFARLLTLEPMLTVSKNANKGQMDLDATKPVFGVTDKTKLKPVSSAIEIS